MSSGERLDETTDEEYHRGAAAHLYGLIISGAVLATASPDFRLVRVAVILLFTLTIYWAAETFVHWIAVRTHVQRDLTGDERRAILSDGWPLVTASAVPLVFLAGTATWTSRQRSPSTLPWRSMRGCSSWRAGRWAWPAASEVCAWPCQAARPSRSASP